MKKTRLLLTVLLILATLLCFASCGGGEQTPSDGPGVGDSQKPDDGNGDSQKPVEKLDITGITFTDAEYTYDGKEKVLAVSGTLPEGVSVAYENEKATDAGTYNAKATLTGENYNTLVLEAKLTIKKADIVGISVNAEQEVKGDGKKYLPTYNGTLPEGTSAKYIFDGKEYNEGVDESGTYSVDIVISGKNYNTLTLNVSFKISLDLGNLANKLIDAFGGTPDPWELLPESFKPENRAVGSLPDFNAGFVNVSDIPANGIGKQMNVVYGLFTKADTALSYVNTVYGALNIIKELYSEFLDGSPDDYKHFEGNAGAFGFSITITDDEYIITATVATVEITLYSNISDASYGALVRLNSTTAFKYTVNGDDLRIALNILNTGSALIDFTRNEDGETVGTLYEYLTVSGVNLVATSALLTVGEDYTTVIGSKGDFIPTSGGRNCEVYDNATGQLVGTEVREDVSGIVFNTYWFPIYDLEGVNSIKKVDEKNDSNADTVYINGYTSKPLQITKVGGLSGKMFSRRYDIEFKTLYFYVYDAEADEYKEESCEIPMLFIQRENIGTFESDFKSENVGALGTSKVELQTSDLTIAVISAVYEFILPVYDEIKDAVTAEDIANYCNA